MQSLTSLRRKATYQVSKESFCWVLSSEPMTESDRSKLFKPERTRSRIEGASPIAADGGFGPMEYEESEDESIELEHDGTGGGTEVDADEGFGDDFDDFKVGAENEDFGDFDDGFEQASTSDEEPAETDPPAPSVQSLPPWTSPFVSKISTTTRLIIAPRHNHYSL